jgi:DNA-binding CsgD family transcriptional regulator
VGQAGSNAERLAEAIAADEWDRVFALFDESWNEFFHDEPALLLEALERMPDEAIDREPKLRLAREYIGRNVKGEGYSTSYRNSVSLEGPLDAVNRLAAWTGQLAGAREAGRLADAVRLVAAAQAFLRQQPTDADPLLSAALPEFHFQWGLALELAGEFDGALAEYNDAYDWAVSTGHPMIESSSAGTIAFLHALHGRNSLARTWLDRFPRDSGGGWWTTAAAVPVRLAEAILHLDRVDREGAARVLEQLTPVQAGERWAPYFLLRAVTETRTRRLRAVMSELDSHLGTIPAARQEEGGGAEYVALTRLVLDVALDRPLNPGTAFAEDRPTAQASLLRQYGALLHALRAHSAGRVKTARLLAAPLLSVSGARPRVLIGALIAASDGPSPQLEEAVELAVTQDSFGLFSFSSPRTRPHVSHLLAHRDADAADLLPPEAPEAAPSALSLLTGREREVAERAAAGETTPHIAAELHVSPNTVKTQLRSAYRKLGVNTRSQLYELLHHHGD